MGRKSPLTEKQWMDIEQRLLLGEKGRVLAREFGVSETAIRKRLGSQTKQIKDVANQLVAAETAFRELPISSQISVRTLADRLKSISEHLCSAAEYGAMTAHRLSGIAQGKVGKIDDAEPLDEASRKELSDIAVLTRMANEASDIGVNLLKANKDAVEDINKRALAIKSPSNPDRPVAFRIIRPANV